MSIVIVSVHVNDQPNIAYAYRLCHTYIHLSEEHFTAYTRRYEAHHMSSYDAGAYHKEETSANVIIHQHHIKQHNKLHTTS